MATRTTPQSGVQKGAPFGRTLCDGTVMLRVAYNCACRFRVFQAVCPRNWAGGSVLAEVFLGVYSTADGPYAAESADEANHRERNCADVLAPNDGTAPACHNGFTSGLCTRSWPIRPTSSQACDMFVRSEPTAATDTTLERVGLPIRKFAGSPDRSQLEPDCSCGTTAILDSPSLARTARSHSRVDI